MTARFLYRPGDVPEHLTPGEVAGLFGVRVATVRRWARSGKITAVRTPGNHRRFPSAQFSPAIDAATGAQAERVNAA